MTDGSPGGGDGHRFAHAPLPPTQCSWTPAKSSGNKQSLLGPSLNNKANKNLLACLTNSMGKHFFPTLLPQM